MMIDYFGIGPPARVSFWHIPELPLGLYLGRLRHRGGSWRAAGGGNFRVHGTMPYGIWMA